MKDTAAKNHMNSLVGHIQILRNSFLKDFQNDERNFIQDQEKMEETKLYQTKLKIQDSFLKKIYNLANGRSYKDIQPLWTPLVSRRVNPRIENYQGTTNGSPVIYTFQAKHNGQFFRSFSKSSFNALLWQTFQIFSPLKSSSDKSAQLARNIIHKINTRDKQEDTNPVGRGQLQKIFCYVPVD